MVRGPFEASMVRELVSEGGLGEKERTLRSAASMTVAISSRDLWGRMLGAAPEAVEVVAGVGVSVPILKIDVERESAS